MQEAPSISLCSASRPRHEHPAPPSWPFSPCPTASWWGAANPLQTGFLTQIYIQFTSPLHDKASTDPFLHSSHRSHFGTLAAPRRAEEPPRRCLPPVPELPAAVSFPFCC